MRSVNKVTILGNVGQDPVVKQLNGGGLVANFSIATSYKAKDKEEQTEWHRVSAFGRTAEIVMDYVGKGSKLYVEGRLQTRTWDKDGEKRYATEIIVSELSLLSSGTQGGKSAKETTRAGDVIDPETGEVLYESDIPF